MKGKIIKVLDKNCKKVKEEIKKNHSYLLPCILEISPKSNQEFFNWLLKVTI